MRWVSRELAVCVSLCTFSEVSLRFSEGSVTVTPWEGVTLPGSPLPPPPRLCPLFGRSAGTGPWARRKPHSCGVGALCCPGAGLVWRDGDVCSHQCGGGGGGEEGGGRGHRGQKLGQRGSTWHKLPLEGTEVRPAADTVCSCGDPET